MSSGEFIWLNYLRPWHGSSPDGRFKCHQRDFSFHLKCGLLLLHQPVSLWLSLLFVDRECKLYISCHFEWKADFVFSSRCWMQWMAWMVRCPPAVVSCCCSNCLFGCFLAFVFSLSRVNLFLESTDGEGRCFLAQAIREWVWRRIPWRDENEESPLVKRSVTGLSWPSGQARMEEGTGDSGEDTRSLVALITVAIVAIAMGFQRCDRGRGDPPAERVNANASRAASCTLKDKLRPHE